MALSIPTVGGQTKHSTTMDELLQMAMYRTLCPSTDSPLKACAVSMAPRQKYLWVCLDSRGKVETTSRQTSNIKSHCAQYHHDARRFNPGPHVPEDVQGKVEPSDKQADSQHESTRNSPVEKQNENPEEDSMQEEQTGAGKKRKSQEWRKQRCTRFRKVSFDESGQRT